MKKVLIIAYNFPPAGGAGVQRTTKFCKYLMNYGWEPSVITASADSYEIKDVSLLKDIGAVSNIERIAYKDFNSYRKKNGTKLWNNLISALNVVFAVPDTKIFWNKKVVDRLKTLLIEQSFDIVYISCAPFSTALLVEKIKKIKKIPVVVDFRDEWSDDPSVKWLPGYRLINRRLERHVFDSADGIITVSQPILDDFIYNNNYRKKSAVIMNGFDLEDVILTEESLDEDVLVLTYIGSFSNVRNPNDLILAIDTLISKKKIKETDIKLVLVGNHEDYKNYKSYITVTGYVSHDKVAAYMQESDLMVVIIPKMQWRGPSGKIFECIGSGKPVLGILPDGVAKDIILETNSGVVCEIGNVSNIEAIILDLVKRKREKTLHYEIKTDSVRRYTREALTKDLANFFEEIICVK